MNNVNNFLILLFLTLIQSHTRAFGCNTTVSSQWILHNSEVNVSNAFYTTMKCCPYQKLSLLLRLSAMSDPEMTLTISMSPSFSDPCPCCLLELLPYPVSLGNWMNFDLFFISNSLFVFSESVFSILLHQLLFFIL